MRLDLLEVSGFMRFEGPAVLDLRDMPEGLVAITGENGEGKTRLLDAGVGAVYGTFPSRKGRLTDYATTPDAYISAQYTFEGRGVYHSRINVDGVKRASDAVLQMQQPDGSFVPLCNSDGKKTTHKDAVASVFPSLRVVLASVYAAQNRSGSFVSLKPGDRKDLFGEFLGHDLYVSMAGTSKVCHELWDKARLRLVERLDRLVRDTADEIAGALRARAADVQQGLAAAHERRDTLRSQIEEAEVDRDSVAEQAQAHRAGLERQQALVEALAVRGAELVRITDDEAAADRACTADLERADQTRDAALGQVRQARVDAIEQHAALVANLEKRIAGNKQLTDDAEKIRTAAAEQEKYRGRLEELRVAREQVRDNLDHAKEQRQERDTKLAALKPVEQQLARLSEQAGLIDRVKFGAQCGGDQPCVLVVNAVEAQQKIAAVEAQVATKAALEEARALWQGKVAEYHTALASIDDAIAGAERSITSLGVDAKYAPELAACQARIDGYEQQRTQADQALHARCAELDADVARIASEHQAQAVYLAQQLADRKAVLQRRRDEVAAQIAAGRQEADALAGALVQTAEAAARLVVLDAALEVHRVAWTSNEATHAALTEREADIARAAAAFDSKVQERGEAERALRQAENRVLVWQTCMKAFGRDGLPTLEIAAAGPTVSALTNDLLEACFGPRFTVELVTQEPSADGKRLKETFDLHIYDNEYGGDIREIEDLSGGERIIVEEALRAGFALYNKQTNQSPIRTCWRDETTGALDPENAVRYVAMLRRLQQIGGFAHILFVTHNRDVADLADVHVRVENGQPAIVRRAA